MWGLMMSSLLTDAHAIRRVQARLSGQAQLTLKQLQELAAGLPPEAVRNLLLEALPGVAQTFGDASAVAAGEWFEELRAREVGSGRAAVLADPVGRVPVEQSVRFASQHLFTDAPQLTFAYLAGQLVKWVAQPARETLIESIDADPVGYGWQRVTRPGACGFCLMLADRGGVYTRKGVYFASHRNCNCGVVPSWDSSLPVVDVEAYRASVRMDKVRARASGPPSKEQRKAQEQLDRHRKRTREAAKRYETNNKGGGNGGQKPPKQVGGSAPSNWSNDDWRKVWDGTVAVRADGTALLRGGHRPGRKWPGKTEFPAGWTEERVKAASIYVWENPTSYRTSGDSKYVRGVVDGVMIEVQAYGPGYKTFRAAYPRSGDGVVLNVMPDEKTNTPSGRIDKPLDLGLLDEEGWSRVDAS